MHKLARNDLAKDGIMVTQEDEWVRLKWSVIIELHYIQEEIGLTFGNKLSRANTVDWDKQSMEVCDLYCTYEGR